MKKPRIKSFIYCELGKVIAKRLIDLGKSKHWLEEQTGLCATAMSSYYRGKYYPSTENLMKIALALEIEINVLTDAILKEVS